MYIPEFKTITKAIAIDLDMLKECGISVAMANAFPEVKAICTYQTTSNDEDGVALVLEKLLNTIT